MDDAIFDYISWLNSITQGEFEHIMRKSGHTASGYIQEKWTEFTADKLKFAMNWHEQLYSYYTK